MMNEENKTKIKRMLSCITDDFSESDIDIIENLQYPLKITTIDHNEDESLSKRDVTIDSFDDLESLMRSLDIDSKITIRIPIEIGTMVLKTREVS